jgi:hypothetical protein
MHVTHTHMHVHPRANTHTHTYVPELHQLLVVIRVQTDYISCARWMLNTSCNQINSIRPRHTNVLKPTTCRAVTDACQTRTRVNLTWLEPEPWNGESTSAYSVMSFSTKPFVDKNSLKVARLSSLIRNNPKNTRELYKCPGECQNGFN